MHIPSFRVLQGLPLWFTSGLLNRARIGSVIQVKGYLMQNLGGGIFEVCCS